MPDAPHFALPFRFATPQAAVNEQDALDEIADCVLAILVCPQGFRIELMQFGLPDPTFSTPAPSLNSIRQTVTTWEPRAAVLLNEHPDYLDELAAHVDVLVSVRSET